MKTRFYAKNDCYNMCERCVHCFAECINADPVFGNGLGHDNVIECNTFEDAGYGVIPEFVERHDGRHFIYFTPADYLEIARVIKEKGIDKKEYYNDKLYILCPDAKEVELMIDIRYGFTPVWFECRTRELQNDFIWDELKKEVNRV